MSNGRKEVLGAWITAIGTITAALGVTPAIVGKDIFLEEDGMTEEQKRLYTLSQKLIFMGNTFQGVGNTLEASAEKPWAAERSGEILQAAGNTTILFSIYEDGTDKGIKLDITGNLLQAFGGLIIVLDELVEFEDDFYIDASGNFLQVIGNTIQATGSWLYLKTKNIELLRRLLYTGSWIQVGGAIIAAYGTMKEIEKNKQEGRENEYEKRMKVVKEYGYNNG